MVGVARKSLFESYSIYSWIKCANLPKESVLFLAASKEFLELRSIKLKYFPLSACNTSIYLILYYKLAKNTCIRIYLGSFDVIDICTSYSRQILPIVCCKHQLAIGLCGYKSCGTILLTFCHLNVINARSMFTTKILAIVTFEGYNNWPESIQAKSDI